MDYSNLQRPLLILVRGLPGSGKSYLASGLQSALGAENVIMLDPDATDYNSQAYKNHVTAATANGVDSSLHAYRFLRAQAWNGIINRRIIIWNQPFTNREIFQKMTAGLQNYAMEAGTELQILVIEVNIPTEIAIQRVAERKLQGGHGPSEQTFTRFINEYESFASEGFLTVEIDGQQPIETLVTAATQAVDQLLAV